MISHLFSYTSFSINIFEVISNNKKYKIKAYNQTIKINLYKAKFPLGIWDININKKSQKIKMLVASISFTSSKIKIRNKLIFKCFLQ